MTIYEDEFDLYPYVQTLLKNWKLIFALGIIAGLAALVFSLLQPRTYSSTATIISTYSRPVLTLSEEFSMVSNNGNVNNKQDAFLAIAKSDGIAQSIYEQFKDRLPGDMSLRNFKERVEITDQGDAIQITASFEDPLLSTEIANAWADATIETINTAYGEAQPLVKIQAQIIEAQASYMAAQDELEVFIEDNEIAQLERNIAEAEQVLSNLHSTRLDIIDTHINSQVDLISQQADQYFNTLLDHTKITFSSQVKEQLNLFTEVSKRKTNLELLLLEAEALKEQLNAGNRSIPGSSGDALALFLSRAQTFGLATDLTLDVTLGEVNNLQDSSANYVSDINRLIEQIDAEISKTNQQIEDLSILLAAGGDYQYFETPGADNPLYQAGMASLDQIVMLDLPEKLIPDLEGTPLDDRILVVSKETQRLEAQLESALATQRALVSERDLAEQAYKALLVKETEIKAGSQTSNEVSLASSAVVNPDPDSRGTITNTLLAGIVGGMLAVVWVFVSTWWHSQSETTEENPEIV